MIDINNSSLKIIVFILLGFLLLFVITYADSSNISITVLNTAPSFTSGPAESPASDRPYLQLQFVKANGSTSGEYGLGVTADDSGNLYAVGYFAGSNVDFDEDNVVSGDTKSSAGGADMYVVKYNSSGVLQWLKALGSTGDDVAQKIILDTSGNIYIIGYFAGSNVDFDEDNVVSGDTKSSAGGSDVFVAKYNSSAVLQWVKTFGGSGGDDWGYQVGIDSSSNVYAIGGFVGSNIDFDKDNVVNGDTKSSAGSSDIFIVKYNSSGVLQWVKALGGSSLEYGRGLAVDSSGNVYATGFFLGSNIDFDEDNVVNGDTKSSAGDQDIFIAKYDTNGILQWLKALGGTLADVGSGINVDSSGNVYATGHFLGSNIDFDEDNSVSGDTQSSAGSADIYIVKYNSSGVLQWLKANGGTDIDYGYSVDIDNSENVYATGLFRGTSIDFDENNVVSGDTKTSAGLSDIFIVKYNNSGVLQWFQALGGTSDDCGYGIFARNTGYIYTTGSFQGTSIDFDEDNSVSGDTQSSAGLSDIYIAVYTDNITNTPTNVGSDVTFVATASDPNMDQYYLAVCKTNAISANNDAPPTCTGGSWCISSATNDDVQATCSYTALAGDSESNAWYAFVCDKNENGLCSSSSQGSGISGSPFYVNHRPSFSLVSNNGPKNPGESITFSSTASDSDTSGVQDTVKLIICTTNSLNGQTCTATTLCSSEFVATNPSCTYTTPIPTPTENTYYAFVIDNHLLAASSRTDTYTTNNILPVVSAVTLNNGNNINLTENTTTNVIVTATITDNNSCTDINLVETSLYRSGIAYSGCDTSGENNNNNCYAKVSCSIVESGNTCTGGSDSSADYTCTVEVQFHADPTDGTSSDTQYYSQNWKTTVIAWDTPFTYASTEVASGVEMNSLIALNVTDTINYGSLGAGTNSGSSPQTITVTNTGNTGLDTEISGTTMTGPGTAIPIGNQEYKTTTFTYGTGIDLTGSAVELELNVLKTTTTASPATKIIYWGLEIPSTQANGIYTGSNTVAAVRGEVAQW